MKITFINEMADLCEKVGANVQDVARGIGLDNRIGSKFLHAGPGYGGSCFPKDTLALIQDRAGLRQRRCASSRRVVDVNDARKHAMAQQGDRGLRRRRAGQDASRVLGLTFKPNTDDMRDAPSLTIIPALQAMGAHVRAYDPGGMDQARPLLEDVAVLRATPTRASTAPTRSSSSPSGTSSARSILTASKGLLAEPVVVDLRNIYRPGDMRRRGFRYVSVGRS